MLWILKKFYQHRHIPKPFKNTREKVTNRTHRHRIVHGIHTKSLLIACVAWGYCYMGMLADGRTWICEEEEEPWVRLKCSRVAQEGPETVGSHAHM
jgi:hypothetical protein